MADRTVRSTNGLRRLKVDIDALEQRRKGEGLENRGAMMGPLLIGAFARNPQTLNLIESLYGIFVFRPAALGT